MTDTVKNIKDAYKMDLKVQTKKYTAKGDSNSKNLIQRNQFAIKVLDLLPDDLILSGSGTTTEGKMNIGVLVEVAINYLIAEEKPKIVFQSGADFDIIYKGVPYEVKTSLNGSCYNTKAQRYDFDFILVNTYGIYRIEKNQVQSLENKRGVLPYKEWIGAKHFIELEKLFKYN